MDDLRYIDELETRFYNEINSGKTEFEFTVTRPDWLAEPLIGVDGCAYHIDGGYLSYSLKKSSIIIKVKELKNEESKQRVIESFREYVARIKDRYAFSINELGGSPTQNWRTNAQRQNKLYQRYAKGNRTSRK